MVNLKLFAGIVLTVLMASFAFADSHTLSREEIEQEIAANLDKIDLSQAPKALKFLLGKPKIKIVLANLDGTESTYGFKIGGNKITDFKVGGLDKPHYIIRISEETIVNIVESEDPAGMATESYKNGDIVIEPQRFGSKIKFWFASKFLDRFFK